MHISANVLDVITYKIKYKTFAEMFNFVFYSNYGIMYSIERRTLDSCVVALSPACSCFTLIAVSAQLGRDAAETPLTSIYCGFVLQHVYAHFVHYSRLISERKLARSEGKVRSYKMPYNKLWATQIRHILFYMLLYDLL